MTATDAIQKIVDLLGLKVKSEKFYSTKLEDGQTEITNNREGETFEIGDEIFVVKDSILQPAPSGEHKTREGLVISVGEDSVVYKIESKEMVDGKVVETETEIEDETKTDMMSSATLTDGTKVETDESGDFKPGQKLYVITQEGERVSAPEGEHTTESGIVLTVDRDGFLTGVKYPDEPGEGSLEEMKKMKEMMMEVVSMMKKMEGFTNDFESFKKDFEEFKKQPDREPVLQTKFSKSNDLLDWKYELIKSSINK